ncbi:titin [Drosophila kikkawai]|uniref:Titin n=1 Tax=Drosophila kikkawai TaxID=30033 RepID=A0A6P4IFU8_DROKI|nr:zinc finger CCCH domain-containing protein 18 [Drosophila kikkawai]
MAIQLDKILAHIAKEKALHPNNGGSTKQEQEEAWARIGRLNKLSVHESRSIFIVLQKKYEQEKLKGNSAWKLFGLMDQIHQEPKVSIKEEDEQGAMDEVEEYEMLEVQEQEEEEEHPDNIPFGQPANSTGSASSDGESPTKSHGTSSPEKEERLPTKPIVDTPRPAFEEKKLLNTLANNTPRATTNSSVSAAAAVLQKKGITVKKTPSSAVAGQKSIPGQPPHSSGLRSASRTTIQLPDSLKRKLSEEYPLPTQKKQPKTTSPKQVAPPAPAPLPPSVSVSEAVPNASVVHTTTAQLMQVKKERESNQTPPPGINIITIPSSQQINGGGVGGPTSSTAATVASTSVASTNGFSPHIDDLDFKNDIIFDSKLNAATSNTPEIINFGNFDNMLPPTFFKNLCNSSRHESLGLYVANVMNRLSSRASAKLELSILRAILDAHTDEMEH